MLQREILYARLQPGWPQWRRPSKTPLETSFAPLSMHLSDIALFIPVCNSILQYKIIRFFFTLQGNSEGILTRNGSSACVVKKCFTVRLN